MTTTTGILKSRGGSGLTGTQLSSKSRPSFRHTQSNTVASKSKKKKLRKKPSTSKKTSKAVAAAAAASSLYYSDPRLEDSGQGSDEKCYCDEGSDLENDDSCSTWSMDSCPLCKAELGEHEHLGEDEIVTDESVEEPFERNDGKAN